MTARISLRTLAVAVAALVTALAVLAAPGSAFAQAAAAPAAPGAAVPAAPAAAPADAIVATVDGDPITVQELGIALDQFSDQLSNFDPAQRQSVAIDLLIHIRLVAKAAAAEGIDKESEVADKLQIAHDRALYSEYLNRLFDKEVTEEAAHKLFSDEQAKAGTQHEYRLRHILVATKAEAQSVLDKLNSGGDFAQIAKDVSIDPGSAPAGGELGFIAAGDTVQEFEDAAFALKVGEYSKTPVESQFGFHVIQLEEMRDATPKTFEESVPDLQNELAQNAFKALIDKLSANVTIVKMPPPAQPPVSATQPGTSALPPGHP